MLFNTIILQKGDHYGRSDSLTWEDDRPGVEIYDAEHAGDSRFDPLGQFVTRYYVHTLFEYHTPGRGTDLCGHEPKWKLTASQTADLIAELKSLFPEAE